MQSKHEPFNGLNEAQKKAASAQEGPTLVVAGPGTGKTLTIVRRIAHLVHEDVNPRNILVVTFTNRAAKEIKTRAEVLLGKKVFDLFIGTFHLLGLKILQETSGKKFTLFDKESQLQLTKTISKLPTRQAEKLMEKISRMKNFQENYDEKTQEAFTLYQSQLRQHNAYDFDDLICAPLELLESNGEVRNRYNERFRHIVVDEYQDINAAQYRLLKILSASNNICAVGDPDQAIYAFRGADIQNFLGFKHDFPSATKIALTENYRSTGVILEAAESMIKNNSKRIDRTLVSMQKKGVAISVVSVPDEKAEGVFITGEIEARIGGTSHSQMRHAASSIEHIGDRPYRFSDFAVLFRTNAQARALEEAFRASGIPYQVLGRKNSAQQKEIEETVSYLRSLMPSEDHSATIFPGDQEAKLLMPEDYFDPRADAVTLMTIHSAKGLEFPVVFMAGCEEGLLPYTAGKDCADTEEERRLCYVGMTRAKDELLILHARKRFLFGQLLSSAPSPFLVEIPAELVKHRTIPDHKREQKRQLGLF